MVPAAFFLLLAAALSLAMMLAWLSVLAGSKSGWVDATWSFLLGAAGLAAALTPLSGWEGEFARRLAVAVAAGVSSSRLGLHIARRTLGGGEDPRYAKLREEWGARWRFRLLVFLEIQAGAALLLAGTIFLAARNPAPGLQWTDVGGFLILSVAIVGEGIADAQLARFRSDPAHKDQVCDVGLWGFSRHPNYFFQWLGWTGYAVIAIGPVGGWPLGWVALAGPVFMYWLLVHVSGIPPLEAHMWRTRGPAFAAYVERVNAFWPGPQTKEVSR